MMLRVRAVLIATTLALGACATAQAPETTAPPAPAAPAVEATQPQDPRPVEATSFTGKPLYRNAPVNAEEAAKIEAQIAALQAQPAKTEADFARLAELQVGVGRFQDAIRVLTEGLSAHPQSYKLRRHRGHRYLNVRDVEKARIDLDQAVTLMASAKAPDPEYRLNGEQNGTYQHWVWYHVGLYNYLNGDYAKAAAAYEQAVATATTPDLAIGSTDWLYNAYIKAGEPKKAAAAIAKIPADAKSDGSPYFKRVMLYKGVLEPGAVLDVEKPATQWTGADVTSGYGVANWYALNGKPEVAAKIYSAILQSPFWNSWAYVVTDREEARRQAG